ncbi:MAG: hypothetical protein ALECFALPRED_000825 [Alectoria fallacina]|uniref:P-loop containing nucleoside triphosphate hydrolase protein n=1 Tax=Alectoria fallacina TaxID=1903189 RepID=A0A8H3F808_9LECA|nr:MAG: hypothetical protein ALECFALPRED_000825 [Alectoria fallacina]
MEHKPRSSRKVPMQVLSLGLPRTGTASMQSALQTLGYNDTAHGFDMISHPEIGAPWMEAVQAKFLGHGKPYGRAEFDALLGNCAAVTDMPCACFWEELMAAYPDAKIILVERDIEDWFKSFEATAITELFSKVADVIVNYIEPLIGSQIGPMNRELVYGFFNAKTPDEVRQNARGVYQEHYRRIREVAPKERLLEYRLSEGWGPLCSFLEKEVPKGLPFPRINETAALKVKIREVQREKFKAASVALGRYLVPVAAVGIAMWYWYRK